MPKEGIFICFTGIDGSGKTTHAISIVSFLIQDYVKCKYVWTRWVPITLKPVIILTKIILFKRSIARALARSNNDYIEYRSAKRRYLKKSLAKIWQNMVLFDYLLQVLIKIRIPLLFGNVVVCDRYVYDTLVDFAVDSGCSKGKFKDMLKMRFVSLFPKPDVLFLLDVPEEVALKRKSDIKALTHLLDRREFYLALGKEYSFIKIMDNSGYFNDTQGKIRDEVYGMLSNLWGKKK